MQRERKIVPVQCIVTLMLATAAYSVNLGPGSYSTTQPTGIQVPVAPYITSNLRGPVLTTDWCANLAFDKYSNNMYAHPLAFKADSNGLALGYPNARNSAGASYFQPFTKDLKVRSPGLNAPSVLMDAYSDWAVTANWSTGTMKATMGHGMPFAYFTLASAEVVATGTPNVWYNQANVIGLTLGTRNYALFAPAGATWSVSGSTLTSTLAGKGYLSVAALPDKESATLTYFKRFAYNFITDTRVSWRYDAAASSLSTTYQVTVDRKEGSEQSCLFALYPHQWLFFAGQLTNYTYSSVRGTMKVVEAQSFTTAQPVTGILPNLPLMATDGQNGFKLDTLKKFIAAEAAKSADQLVQANADTYWTGKGLGRTAQLIRIAEQIGNLEARDKFLTVLKSKLQDWLTYETTESAEYFYYHKQWGTLIGLKASYGSDKNLNDHHFHYGYYIYAAATVAQYDRTWADSWKPMVDLLIRDCNSPFRSDTLFPFMRAFDIYAGHSWASGDAAFADGNNQESTSEAINFEAGTALWGIATGDTVMRNLGLYLYTTEKNALLNYWFDVNEIVFPTDFSKIMVGMIWGAKADHATWFSGEPEAIHGINMLPVTAASLYLGHKPSYVLANYAEIVAENNGPVNSWYDIMWEFLALGDGTQAVTALTANPSYAPEDGESRAHTYHWIHNLRAVGNVNGTVTANTLSFAVFDKGGVRIYVVYNPEAEAQTVRFSDGKTVNVQAHTLLHTTGTATVRQPPCAASVSDVRIMRQGNAVSILCGQAISGTVLLHSISGKRIASARVVQGSARLDLSEAAPGIYYLTIPGQAKRTAIAVAGGSFK